LRRGHFSAKGEEKCKDRKEKEGKEEEGKEGNAIK